jgi:diguanylate cyclase (GGDEF)-like protein
MPLLYVPTIYVLTLSVMALLGVLMLFAWLQNRAIRALAWWSGAVLLMAIALGLLCLRGVIPNLFSLDLAYVVLFTSCGLMLEGARCFEGQPRSLLVVFGGAAMWFGVCQAPVLYDSVTARTVIVSTTVGFYSLACAYVMWKGRSEPLMSRWPLTVLLALGGVLFLVRVPFAIAYPLAQTAINSVEALQSVWYAIFSASTLLYIIAVYFLFLALTKERTELAHKQAAMTDPLTALFNRRAFIDLAERRLKQRERNGTALAFLVFDLDWFKSVNDTHGHAIGDLALRLFAGILRTNLRPEDIAGRLGGEEFAAILSGADEAAVMRIAERIREKFAAAGELIEGETVEVTVSVGVACCRADEAADLEGLAEAADEALYRAKAHGRNRVELAGDETVALVPELPDEDVTTVAA